MTKTTSCRPGARTMQFRRNDFDVSNRINTTDPVCVKLEVARTLPRPLLARAPRRDGTRLRRPGGDVPRARIPAFEKCDTDYHDLQHVLDVSLAMARLLDGYERSRGDAPAIGARLFQLGVICALFHDCGYLRRRGDTRHRRGAEYTRIHVSRGARVLRGYLPTIGLGRVRGGRRPDAAFHGLRAAGRHDPACRSRCSASWGASSARPTSSRRCRTAVTSRNATTGCIRSSSTAASRGA